MWVPSCPPPPCSHTIPHLALDGLREAKTAAVQGYLGKLAVCLPSMHLGYQPHPLTHILWMEWVELVINSYSWDGFQLGFNLILSGSGVALVQEKVAALSVRRHGVLHRPVDWSVLLGAILLLQVSGSYNRNRKTTVWLGSQAVGHAHICWVAALSDKPWLWSLLHAVATL